MSFLNNIRSTIENGIEKLEDAFEGQTQSYTHRDNRFHSFAPPRTGNDAKWFVDGCGYMWAVSVAIEEARESIWILDWWLSPELYLRRPPSANENYRLDRMLLAAAERGVKVNVIVYKEVSQILTLCSEHTKKALELHPNISVFRHPDHAPSSQSLQSQLVSGIKDFSFKTLDLASLPCDGLKAIYGARDDIILYWAHHEKLCLIDGKIAFMGGLDLCFGRWDTNAHPFADAHPTDVDQALFPGQDFNNARVYDFEDVTHYMNNKLDRTKNSRMGWSDVSLCLRGPVVDDLRAHFVQRWNYIFKEKYDLKGDKYTALSLTPSETTSGYYKEDGSNVQAGIDGNSFHLPSRTGSLYDTIHDGITSNIPHFSRHNTHLKPPSGVSVQLVRSCTQWSNGVPLEHSIANAYIEVIRNSKHFVYIENQFFITSTGDKQRPVKNKIGAALVERIVRAHQAGEKYKVIVCMPSVPAFAGDLHAEDSLGTRAIMEYQYHSICRGGYSIMEEVQKAGVPDAKQYIRFYNLRNYDRINAGKDMSNVEQASGIAFEDARKEHDDIVGAGYDGKGEETGALPGQPNPEYDSYQQAASQVENTKYDSVCECYMDGGPSLKDIPWSGSEEAEMDAFVSEELYIHSKVLIADDRVVICGSANLNDRSQVGSHDSEIAVVIEDHTLIDSVMNGQAFQASKYATSLRRQLFRKHLGLLPWQDWAKPDANFLPIDKDPNVYDWGSPADLLVRDPLSREFANLWDITASTNTEVFTKAFHCVPADNVRNWKDYEAFFGDLFVSPADKKNEKEKPGPKYAYGHIVKDEFPGGTAELKDWLDRVRGTLVEMPLLFMDEVDFAVEGLKFNVFTDEVYT
ncbi:putative phospholipase D1 [Venustampulla echinocandica]|uniref:Phospholipase n=1 Tax=Venustampulla echinocandica TaxID=2656787 RepID=A0A370TT10_9HELO|nr:putative phospholipase D1 [Venustampulla echinocandica]RDL38671.1 putative phospholipase D1 [Venustampulla echinocandica]